MSHNGSCKKSRGPRTTLLQYNRMLDFFSEVKGLAEGKYHVVHGKEAALRKWNELAIALNAVSGAQKTAKQWQVVWRDLKSKATIRAREQRKKSEIFGTDDVNIGLSALYLRVIELVGYFDESASDDIKQDEEESQTVEANESVFLEPIATNSSTTEDDGEEYLHDEEPLANSEESLDDMDFEESTCVPKKLNIIPITEKPTLTTRVFARRPVQSLSSFLLSKKRKLSPIQTTDMLNDLETIESKSQHSQPSDLPTDPADDLQSTSKPSNTLPSSDPVLILANAAHLQAEAAKINAIAMHTFSKGIEKMGEGIQKLGEAVATQTLNNAEQLQVMREMIDLLQNCLPVYLNE